VSWLSGWYDELIFDDMPYTVWLARPEDLGSIEASLHRIGKFTVQFRCRPFNRDIIDLSEVKVGSIVPVGRQIPINYQSDMSKAFDVGNTEFIFNNVGDAPTLPIIKITAAEGSTISNIQIQINGCTLSYKQTFSELSLNCATWQALSGESEVTSAVYGDYPEIIPGRNEMTVSANGSGTISFVGYPQYLYGAGGLTNA
jgi:phage-related protein